MRLNHNMYSLGIYKTYTKSVKNHSDALGKIGSGLKIRNAKDNPNKIAQAESLRMTVIGRNAAASNIQDTTSMIQTFEGAMQEMNNNVSRLKQLVVQANNGTYNDGDKKIIQKEIDSICESLNDLAKGTEFNGISLSDDDGIKLSDLDNGVPAMGTNSIVTTIGTLADETVQVPSFNLSLKEMGLTDENGNSINVLTETAAKNALTQVDKAVTRISAARSMYGAVQNRLDETETSMSEISDVLTEAQSDIADADIANEILEVTKNKLLIDSAIGLMVQSNKLPQDALNILANVR